MDVALVIANIITIYHEEEEGWGRKRLFLCYCCCCRWNKKTKKMGDLSSSKDYDQ